MNAQRSGLAVWACAALLLAAWSIVYLPGLGATGLTDTEGHRAVPAFELLEKTRAGDASAADWIAPTLFERVYLRKPPGMTWAVAASAWVFGAGELSARLVSAVSMLLAAVASAVYAGRWFGPGARLAGGLAALLMPVLWIHGRAAELEAPMFAATLAASLAAIDLLLHQRRSMASAAVLAVGTALMLFVKGPAGLPALAGAVAACAIVERSVRTLTHGRLWWALFSAAVVFVAWWFAAARLTAGTDVVSQSPGAFLWDLGRLGDMAVFAPAVLIMGLPMTLAALFPWGPDALAEPLGQEPGPRKISRGLVFAMLITLGVFLLSGVSNNRYGLPALVFVPPLAGWCVAGMQQMTAQRARIARWMLLGEPRVMTAMLVIGGIVFALWLQPTLRTQSGREAGRSIAATLPAGAMVIADHAIEARPEVLWELERADARVRWLPAQAAWPAEAHVLVRADATSDEVRAHEKGRASLGAWRVHEYTFELLSPLAAE